MVWIAGALFVFGVIAVAWSSLGSQDNEGRVASDRSALELHLEQELPGWLRELASSLPAALPLDPSALMRIALDVLQEHITRKTGGPFAALVVESRSGRLMGIGVNRVVPSSDCTAHAEIIALRMANAATKSFDLEGSCTLVTTAQMCGMCLTAAIWSGVGRIIIGARAADTEALAGFDVGILTPDWLEQLRRRGIEVLVDVERERARSELKRYVDEGGVVYNGHRAPPRG